MKKEWWPTIWGATLLFLLTAFVNWPTFKGLLIQLMAYNGVDWTDPSQVTDGDKLNAVIGILIGVIGVVLGFLGYRIEAEQERHFEEEKKKHAKFDLTCPEVRGHRTEHGGFTLWVTNVGKRASRGIVYLGVPKRISEEVHVVAAADGIREVPVLHGWDIRDDTLDHPGQLHFHDDYVLHKFEVEHELLPSDRRLCATVAIPYRRENMRRVLRSFRWFTQTADERNPPSDTNEIILGNPSQHTYDWDLPDTL